MKVTSTYKTTVYVELSESEVDEIYNYVDLDEMDVELFEGENCLDVATWDEIHDALDNLEHHNQTSFALLNGLRSMLKEFKKDYTAI